MLIKPGETVHVYFSVHVNGEDSSAGEIAFTVCLDATPTTVPVVVQQLQTGQYNVMFTVPSTWVTGQDIFVKAELTWGVSGDRMVSCTKYCGRVSDVPNNVELTALLAVADQVRDGDTINYYEAGTNQQVLLHRQVINGDPCDGNVSIVGQ